jgi:hypothetical protein
MLDHLVYATPDLDAAVDRVESLLGIRARPGGRHPGIGTRNALVSFGGERYLEIVGPDPEQPEPPAGRWFRIDELEEPRLVTWCARSGELEQVVRRAASAGVSLGAVGAGGRRRPDGSDLRWRVSDPTAEREGGVVPFFIDWLDSPHPGVGPGDGCALVELRARHPEAPRIARAMEVLGLGLTVEEGPRPALEATVRTPGGLVTLA